MLLRASVACVRVIASHIIIYFHIIIIVTIAITDISISIIYTYPPSLVCRYSISFSKYSIYTTTTVYNIALLVSYI